MWSIERRAHVGWWQARAMCGGQPFTGQQDLELEPGAPATPVPVEAVAPLAGGWVLAVARADPGPDAPRPVPPQAPPAADATDAVAFDETVLFRYSALTFNGHRIHYDAAYAREVEGYAGLVVHGPLLAQLLMLMAEAQLGPLSGFSFRATAPLILGRQAWLCRAGSDLWVAGEGGIQHMSAQAIPSE